MKTGNSDHYPDAVVMSNGFKQIYYDITPVQITNMDGKVRNGYDYKYIEVDGDVEEKKIEKLIEENEDRKTYCLSFVKAATKPKVEITNTAKTVTTGAIAKLEEIAAAELVAKEAEEAAKKAEEEAQAAKIVEEELKEEPIAEESKEEK